MTSITGEHTSATVFLEDTKESLARQIKFLCDLKGMENSKLVFLPNAFISEGQGLKIPSGTTVMVEDRIMPAVLGSYAGLGVSIVHLKGRSFDFHKLVSVINSRISNISTQDNLVSRPKFNKIKADLKSHYNIEQRKKYNTVGGGKEFIEVDKDNESNDIYLVVRSGEVNLASKLFEYYANKGFAELKANDIDVSSINNTYLTEGLMNDYINDIMVLQTIAEDNRKNVINAICNGMQWQQYPDYRSYVHYGIGKINNKYIVRRAAISAKGREPFAMLVNAKDGVLFGYVNSNLEDWNYSIPCGVGRAHSNAYMNNTGIEAYENAMHNVFTPGPAKPYNIIYSPQAYKRTLNADTTKPYEDILIFDNLKLRPIFSYRR